MIRCPVFGGTDDSETPTIVRMIWVLVLALPLATAFQENHVQALQSALKLREQGRSADAGAALERLATTPGLEPGLAARVHNALGLVRRDQARWDDAVSLFKTALDLVPAQTNDCALRPTITGNLGEVRLQQGRMREARSLFQDALNLARKCPTQTEAFAALQMLNLAGLARMQGDYKLAVKLAESAHDELRRSLGERHPHTVLALNNVAQIYASQGKRGESTEAMERVKDLTLQVHGEGHPLYSGALSNLGVAYFTQQRYDEAEPLLRKALALDQAKHGERHPSVVRDMNNLAAVLDGLGRTDQADELLRRAVEASREMGQPHAGAMASLGALELRRGRVDEAAEWFNEVSGLVRRGAVGGDPDLPRRLEEFASTLRSLKRSADAERYQTEAIRLRTRALIHVEELRKMNYSELWKGNLR
jgi:tetratricopeptide (TPR) repeat protein